MAGGIEHFGNEVGVADLGAWRLVQSEHVEGAVDATTEPDGVNHRTKRRVVSGRAANVL